MDPRIFSKLTFFDSYEMYTSDGSAPVWIEMEIIPGRPLTVLFTASMQCLHDRFETFRVTFFITLNPFNKKGREALPAPCRVEAFVALNVNFRN